MVATAAQSPPAAARAFDSSSHTRKAVSDRLFGVPLIGEGSVWSNPARRGSDPSPIRGTPAGPGAFPAPGREVDVLLKTHEGLHNQSYEAIRPLPGSIANLYSGRSRRHPVGSTWVSENALYRPTPRNGNALLAVPVVGVISFTSDEPPKPALSKIVLVDDAI